MNKETWESRLKSLKNLQQKLKDDVEEQELYIRSLEEYIKNYKFKMEENLND